MLEGSVVTASQKCCLEGKPLGVVYTSQRQWPTLCQVQLALCYMSLENCHRCQFYHHFEYDVPEPHYLRMNKLFRVFGLNLPSYNLQFSRLERLFAHVASLVV